MRLTMARLCAAGLAGCASVPRSVSQSPEIEAVTPLGALVHGSRCQLCLGDAEWEVLHPARTTVISSGDDLQVRCEAADGAALGAADDRGDKNGLCCSGLGKIVGTAVGLGLGALGGALSADPACEDPDKVRVTPEPVARAASQP